MKAFFRAFFAYLRTNWKWFAGVGLTAAVGLNYAFHVVPSDTMNLVIGLAAAVGIGLHHAGEPVPRYSAPSPGEPREQT